MFSRFTVQAVAIGFSSVLLLLSIKAKNSFLIKIGGFAYGIFLFHLFFAAAFRIAITRAGIQNQLAILVLTTVLSIVFSILIEKVLRKSPILRLIFLGLSFAQKKTETSELIQRNIKTEEKTSLVV
jgi:peptidoglycan/LPS O-acetylase OafA/YrhL